MALIPHLRKNKGAALGVTLEVFQFVADTLPPGPKWALPGTEAFISRRAPSQCSLASSLPQPAQDSPSIAPAPHGSTACFLEGQGVTWRTSCRESKMSPSVVKIEVTFWPPHLVD